ncbi:hypothetical protein GCM10010402_10010 [Actinomadura luteofluorescens]|uniref:hypothetical protein n=1 Tax=Actinomadura luteofluorescens TaxID=46163 RepID=UPI0021645ED3|nr:hypothetical protein [Actinomadura glauciflava]MCR3738548.1 Threonine/homoserine efflux transporter RhtA [Actinomadura glauciflava]
MSRLWGALMEALSLICVSVGAAYATRLYPEHSTVVVGALITTLGAFFFSLATHLPRGRVRRQRAKVRWNRRQWKWVLVLLIPSIFQGQVHQAALERVDVGTLMTVMTLGALSLATWRLVSAPRRSGRWLHALWFVIGLAGVAMLTRPFTGGAGTLGLVLTGVAAVIGVNGTIASGKLTEMGTLHRVVELNCWAGACLVGVPVLVLTDEHWVTWYVLSTVVVTSLLNMIANKLHVRAFDLVRSDDGLISTVKCVNPVLACLVGVVVGTGGAPGLAGWIGAVLVVGASLAAFRAFHRLGLHAVAQTLKGAVWKEPPAEAAPNGGGWGGIPPTSIWLRSVWKPDDHGPWKYKFA